jgi:hypothetical protein
MGIIRRWRTRRTTNQLCQQAADVHLMLDNPSNNTIRHGLLGELTSIRINLCHLHGWNPNTDINDDGPADKLIQAYREHHDPDNAPDPW